MRRVGIVGTGTMGRVVATRLLANDVAVCGYDNSEFCIRKGREAGITMFTDLRSLADHSECIILFLPGPREIATCVAGKDGLLSVAHAGTIVVDMCTSAPENTRAMESAARAAGIGYIDAPVLGRPMTVGKWALPVGGDPAALEEVRPLLNFIAAHVTHMGGPGCGHTVKLLNQLMFGAINAMTAEMMAVAEKVGIPPTRLYEIIIASQAATVSNLFRELGGRVSEERYLDPTFTVTLLTKDVRLGVEMADAAGAPVILGRVVDYMNKKSCAQGYGDQDTSVMWQGVKKSWE